MLHCTSCLPLLPVEEPYDSMAASLVGFTVVSCCRQNSFPACWENDDVVARDAKGFDTPLHNVGGRMGEFRLLYLLCMLRFPVPLHSLHRVHSQVGISLARSARVSFLGWQLQFGQCMLAGDLVESPFATCNSEEFD
jgi:hypothetical protein